MNQFNEVNNVVEDKPLKMKKYTRNATVKIVLMYMLLHFILNKIPFMKNHQTISGIISTGAFFYMSIKMLSKFYKVYLQELLYINNIDVDKFERSKKKYILLHKSGHVIRFNGFKELKSSLKVLLPIYILFIYLIYDGGDYSINNVLLVTAIVMPAIALWIGHKKWIDNGALKLMGINRDDLKEVD